MDELIDALQDVVRDTDSEEDEEEATARHAAARARDVSHRRPQVNDLGNKNFLSVAEMELPWLSAANFDPSDPIVAEMLKATCLANTYAQPSSTSSSSSSFRGHLLRRIQQLLPFTRSAQRRKPSKKNRFVSARQAVIVSHSLTLSLAISLVIMLF